MQKLDRGTKFLKSISKMNENSVYWELNTTKSGLDAKSISANMAQYGANIITKSDKKTKFDILVESFANPFIAILVFIAGVSAFTDIISPILSGNKDEINPATVIIILTLVLVSGFMNFFQESKSGKAAEALLAMIKSTITVSRSENGKIDIPTDKLVVGDIFYISSGSIIPADARILESNSLVISQASLTGESDQLERSGQKVKKDYDSVTDIPNLVFAGSNVVSGSAKAVVLTTGDNTMIGSIAKQVSKKEEQTSFDKGISDVSWVLIKFMLIMVPLVFIVSGITKGDWLSAFIFALSVAIGLTPEMLPMIVTTCLSQGAVSMSKKKTIIKNLSSIQNFGAMNILCTDKTGTLTEDRIVLELYINPNGENDDKVCKYAYLNSFFQTGLKNPIDKAIISFVNENKKISENNFKLIDEIPFDFKRRRLSVIVSENDKKYMVTKGAIEEMLSICSSALFNNKPETITEKIKEKVVKISDDLNAKGMRVIALAKKDIFEDKKNKKFEVSDENNMTLIGFLAFLDPPRDSSKKAIKVLKEHGVITKILTGDNDKVTKSVCSKVGLPVENLLLGSQIEKMSDDELKIAAEKTTVFAKLTPNQKAKVVSILRENGHVVGFMGDGINDAAAMKKSDIGISVENAVDIAKESADVILMEKDLMVLENGIIEGRKTYANMIKYIKITSSSNFGNMFSVLAASALLPFMPMASLHLILLNLISDISSMVIPWDNVDKEFLKTPRKWEAKSVSKFMVWNGPISSIFDWITYAVLYFIICPKFVSNGLLYSEIAKDAVISSGIFSGMNMRTVYMAMFQTGWLIECIWSQVLVTYILRTPKIPIIQSRPSKLVTFVSLLCCVFLNTLTLIPWGQFFGFVPMPVKYFGYLILILIMYIFSATLIKDIYLKINRSWL